MLLQTTTPDTFGYMLLGYAFIFGLPLLWGLSLWLRQRNLEKDLEVLEQLKQERP